MKLFTMLLAVLVGSQLLLNIPGVIGQEDVELDATSNATETTTKSTQETTQSTNGTTQSTKETTQSTKETTQSTKETTQSSTATTQSSTATTQSTKETTQSTKKTTQSTKETTQSSTATTQSTKETTQPTATTVGTTVFSTESSESTETAFSSATTSVITSATTPQPNLKQNFTCEVNGTTKFGIIGSFALTIVYTAKDNLPASASVHVPQTTDYVVNCTDLETLKFEFFKGWSIEYIFQQSGSTNLIGATNNYYVSNITVKYVHDENLPNSATENKTDTAAFASKNYLESSNDGYYSCNSNTTLKIDDKVTLTTTDFKYKAYNAVGHIDFNSGSVNECAADEETSSIVPIAVGAALAGLVVIVLIAYLIGRRRSRKGYDSV